MTELNKSWEGKPPPESPIATAWNAFVAMAIPSNLPPAQKRYMKHAFYAGARSAFRSIIDAMQEQMNGNEEGEQRFASIELEIEKYFSEVTKAAGSGPRIIQS